MTDVVGARDDRPVKQHRAASYVLAGVGAVVAIAVMDLFFDPGINFSGTLAVAPFIPAVAASPRATAWVGALAFAVAMALFVVDKPPLSVMLAQGIAVALSAVMAPRAAAARQRRERALRDLSRVANVAQRAILAPLAPALGPLALSAAYLSASREALIGGDLYAAAESDRGVRLILGDVRGKGLDAVAVASLVVAGFREATRSPTLLDVVHVIDDRLRPELSSEDFVTAVLAEILPDGSIELVSCGHHQPVLWTAGTARVLEELAPSTPFGLDPEPVPLRMQLNNADRLLFYTDGLVEARDTGGRFIELDSLLAGLAWEPLAQVLDRLLLRLRTRAGEITDDLALLLIEYCAKPSAQSHASSARLPAPRPLGAASQPPRTRMVQTGPTRAVELELSR